jgi:hypothetical protein
MNLDRKFGFEQRDMYDTTPNSDPPPAYSEIVVRPGRHGDPTDDSIGFFSDKMSSGEEYFVDDLLDEENKLKIARELYIRKQIEHNYPVKYILIDSILIAVLNVTLIVMQIVAMYSNAALSAIGSGVWAGLYNILVVILVLLTSNLIFNSWK